LRAAEDSSQAPNALIRSPEAPKWTFASYPGAQSRSGRSSSVRRSTVRSWRPPSLTTPAAGRRAYAAPGNPSLFDSLKAAGGSSPDSVSRWYTGCTGCWHLGARCHRAGAPCCFL